MKKSSVALGVAALASGLVHAGYLAGNANTIELNPNGIGHKLIVPYFTVQGNNATLLNIVNHDTKNGKAVKVRFRGAANSDDIFDFQLFLSPGDVWTAAITQGADGRARLQTSDKSCTLPSNVNQSFVTSRLDAKSSKSVEEQTREGYVEIINMADIPEKFGTSTNPLYTAIKHVNGVAPCGSVVNNLATAPIGEAVSVSTDGMTGAGFNFPTTGLSADWIIINQKTTAAWSGSAVALEARNADGPTAANFVFFNQSASSVSTTTANIFTADPLLANGKVAAALYDFPDLSTPYVGASTTTAGLYVPSVTEALRKPNVANEFVTDPVIAAQTDLVLTQPTRRYYAAVDYNVGGSNAIPVYSSVSPNLYNGRSELQSRVLCVNQNGVEKFVAYNREEKKLADEGAVISPGVPTQFFLCGEAAVTSINAGNASQPSALSATLARNNIELADLVDGWISFQFTTALPVIGNAYLRAANGAVNYGFTWPHKTKQ